MIDIVIDCDPGVDDALALIFALKSKEMNVRAITAVGGNVPVDKATENVLKILELTGMTEVPVAKGYDPPGVQKLREPISVHGEDGLGGATLPTPRISVSSLDATEMIVSYVEELSGDLTLIGVGPLTNIAAVIEEAPEAIRKVRHLTIMGGAISVPGNVTPTSEFNIFMDPEAAKTVFNAGLPITLVPLDVTTQVLMREEHLDELRGIKKATTDFIVKAVEYYLDVHRTMRDMEGCPLHDPLAVAHVGHPHLMKAESLHVDVETKGEITLGETVADLRLGRRVRKPPNMEVCVKVAVDESLRIILDTLKD